MSISGVMHTWIQIRSSWVGVRVMTVLVPIVSWVVSISVVSAIPSSARSASESVMPYLDLVLDLLVGQLLPDDFFESCHFLMDSLLDFSVNNSLDTLSNVEGDLVKVIDVLFARWRSLLLRHLL